MSTVAFIRRCLAAGMAFDAALIAAEAYEAEPPKHSKGAARTAKWRENKASQNVTVTVGDDGDAGDVSPPEVRPLSPQTPLTPTPTPPDITTRAKGPSGFADFWDLYPSKVAKRAAEKAYVQALKRIKGPDPPSVLLAGVVRARSSRKWLDGIIPNPATWLNQDRWEDQPAEIVNLQPRHSHERPHHDAKFEARQANLARAFAGADSAARQPREP